MQIEIISPDKKLFEGEVSQITLPGVDGSLGILNNHAPLISVLKSGTIRLKEADAKWVEFPVKGGVIEVFKNKVIILAE
jgi:F-type H+-transporting ATPase subunit epsilon